MALDKPTLKNEIKAAFAEQAEESDADAAIDRIATKLANAIEKYVKSGDGKYQTGSLKAGTTVVTENSSPVIKIE